MDRQVFWQKNYLRSSKANTLFTVGLASTLLFLDKVPIFSYLFKGYSFEQIIRIKPMMKLAIIFLPVLFAVIWAAFVGLRINKVEIRDGKRKLVNY